MTQPFDLDDVITHLRRTPQLVRALLHNLPDEWTTANYGEDTFSPRDVVGHLILGEKTDWIPRAKIILKHGEARPFDPFPHTGVDPETKTLPIGELIDEFERLRNANIESLVAMDLTDEQFDLRGTHPDPNFPSVTLRNLIATWMVHDLHHIAQINKALARQYANHVGPWCEYVGILNK